MVDPALAEELLALLCSGGADYAEVFARAEATLTLAREPGAPASVEHRGEGGVSLVLERGGRLWSSALGAEEPEALREEARRVARGTGIPTVQYPPHGRARGIPPAGLPRLTDAAGVERLLDAAAEAARAADPRVCGFGAVYRETTSVTLRVGTEGATVRRADRLTTLYSRALAKEGAVAAWGTRAVGEPGGITADAAAGLGAEAARAACQRAEARPAPAGTLPAVLGPQAAGLFVHEAVAHALEADALLEGGGPWGAAPGGRMASEALTVAQLVPAPGALDDEGWPVAESVLVETGVWKGALTDRRSALRLSLPRTGSGRRDSFRSLPAPRSHHLAVSAGRGSLQELLGGLEFGLYAARLGSGSVDPLTGTFRFPVAEGVVIREGAVGEAVRGAVLQGRTSEALAALVWAGGRRERHAGLCRRGGLSLPVWDLAPALLFERIEVAREVP